jgi:hypothetical protein
VQVAKLVKSELKVYGKWSLDSAAIGVAWLDDHVCVFFWQIYLFLVCSLFIVFAFSTTLAHALWFILSLKLKLMRIVPFPDAGGSHVNRTTIFVRKGWHCDSPN